MKCVVLSSGGLDSTVTIAIAKNIGYEIISLSFDYGQRHKIELECAKKVAKYFNVLKHIIVNVPFDTIGGSALTNPNIKIPEGKIERKNIPITYVPGRNIIFLSIAVSVAEICKTSDIFIGVNAIDYSGYPDCRPEFIKQFENKFDISKYSLYLNSSIGIPF
jgi:7-cyano-7-deazaguanine synthase